MKNLTKDLLNKVRQSITLRDSHNEQYIESFRQAETFITATINGQLEFVPMQLLYLRHNKYQITMEVSAVFGQGIEHSQLDDRLIKFYNDHNLKRDIDSITDSVLYHIKPVAANREKELGQLDWRQIERLSKYAGKPYKASDGKLKLIGQDFASFIMHPTNTWGEQVVAKDYIIEPERYWQVAGHFKTFTWTKFKHKKHVDKQLFFSVGVDIKASKLILKLDCLRSGSHKLSNYDIRKFDYYTENLNCITEVDKLLAESVGWDTIIAMSNAFIADLESVYLGVVDYIWGGKIDLGIFKDKLFNVLPENAKYSSGENGKKLPDLHFNTVLDGIVRYEQYMLAHADKTDLAALVKFSFDQITQIESYEFDGQHKQIYVVGCTGGSSTPFTISEELRQLLKGNDHAYIYQVYDYNELSNCGKMVIRRGDPKLYAKLESSLYIATIK